MSLDEKFIPIRTGFYNIVEGFFQKIAGLFGYPENPGMPTIYDLDLMNHMLDQAFLIIFHHIKLFGPLYNDQKHGLK